MQQILEFINTTEARLVLGITGILILCLIAYYIAMRLRGQISNDPNTSHDMLSNFEENHSKGDISEQEYRKIKTQLSNQLKEELTINTDEE